MSDAPAPGAQTRALLDSRAALADEAADVLHGFAESRAAVITLITRERDRRTDDELARIEIDRLRETTTSNLRPAALEDAGVRTVRDVLHTDGAALERLPGVGPHTARSVIAAAEALADGIEAGFRVRIAPGSDGPLGLDLVALLHRHERLVPAVEPHARDLSDFASSVPPLASAAAPAANRLRYFFVRGAARRTRRCGAWLPGSRGCGARPRAASSPSCQ